MVFPQYQQASLLSALFIPWNPDIKKIILEMFVLSYGTTNHLLTIEHAGSKAGVNQARERHCLPIQNLHAEWASHPPMGSNVKEGENLKELTMYRSEGTPCLYMTNARKNMRPSPLTHFTVALVN